MNNGFSIHYSSEALDDLRNIYAYKQSGNADKPVGFSKKKMTIDRSFSCQLLLIRSVYRVSFISYMHSAIPMVLIFQ